MEYVVAYDFATECENLHLAIAEHFCKNCEPPVPLYMVAIAIEAINAVLKGEKSAVIDLPLGVTWRDELTVRAQSAVDSLHLAAFVDYLRDQERVNDSVSVVLPWHHAETIAIATGSMMISQQASH